MRLSVKQLQKIIDGKPISENILSDIDATAYFLDMDISTNQYQKTKNISDAMNAHFLPSYDKILQLFL